MVTIAFAILERMQHRVHFFESWSPGKLPQVRDPHLIPRSSSSVELAVNLLFFTWLAVYCHSTEVQIGSTVRISLDSVWLWFFLGYLLLALANAVLAAMKLMHPYWTTRQASFRLLTDAAGSVLFCWLMKANILTGIAISGVAFEKTAILVHLINHWMDKLFPAAIVVGVVILAVNIYRIVRLQSGPADLSA
jgi:hypothetical protein